MRLWHKDLIPYLPDKQLISQWRECCAIAGNIAKFGYPHHLLVNKIIDYPIDHFYSYTFLVLEEMKARDFEISPRSFQNFQFHMIKIGHGFSPESHIPKPYIFAGWHTYEYFLQCYYNLAEKHDCGGISDEEWKPIKAAKITYVDH